MRHFVSANQRYGAKLLNVAQYSYNLQRNEVTNRSLFELAMGQQLLTPYTLVMDYIRRSPMAYKFAKGWQEQADVASSSLEKAARKMKEWVDEKR